MPCFKPKPAWMSSDGKLVFSFKERFISFARERGFGGLDDTLSVPCGQCMWCRLRSSRDWATRISHEAEMHSANSFLTLTYSDEFLPSDGSLDYRAIPLFMEHLRKRLDREFDGIKVRSFGCAEYGEQFARPHYHLCLFGFDFSADRYLWRKGDFPLFRSPMLEELWPFGHSSIGSLTFESAAYVARYVTKKINGKKKDSHYGDRLPERSVAVSLKPGIGASWLESYMSDVYPSDEVILDGRPLRPPRYYDKILERLRPDLFGELKLKRIAFAKEEARNSRINIHNLMVDRVLSGKKFEHPLFISEKVFHSKMNTFAKRSFERGLDL